MRTSEWHQEVIDRLTAEVEDLEEMVREQCKVIVELSRQIESKEKKNNEECVRGKDIESADTSAGFR